MTDHQTPAFALAPAIVSSLRAHLRRNTEAELRFSDGACALYATDASNYRQVPLGVLIPRRIDEVEEILTACREHDLPVLPRGGGAPASQASAAMSRW